MCPVNIRSRRLFFPSMARNVRYTVWRAMMQTAQIISLPWYSDAIDRWAVATGVVDLLEFEPTNFDKCNLLIGNVSRFSGYSVNEIWILWTRGSIWCCDENRNVIVDLSSGTRYWPQQISLSLRTTSLNISSRLAHLDDFMQLSGCDCNWEISELISNIYPWKSMVGRCIPCTEIVPFLAHASFGGPPHIH